MSPLVLLERLQRFNNNLMQRVHHIHSQFLKSIGVSISLNSIKKWHPKFNLDEVEDIIAAELPQKPNTIKLITGEDIKKIAGDVHSVRVKSAVDAVLKQQEKIVEIVAKNNQIVPSNGTLKEKKEANDAALLARIREKQKVKEIENMIINSETEKRSRLLGKYTDCIRFVKSYFHAEKKATIDLENVCNKMHDSLLSYKANEYEVIVRELCKDFPDWMSIIKVREKQYVKIDKKIELNDLLANVDSMIQAAQA